MEKLIIDGLSCAYDDVTVVEDIHIKVEKGTFVGIIGPNGSGKSTILKSIYNGVKLDKGMILLDGENIKSIKSKNLAKKLAVVGQENAVPFNFTVREIAAMGRTAYKKLFEADNAEDRKIVNKAMETVGISELADRDFSKLSGGEKQRVLIARALVQQTDFLVLDEPTNHLDICFQMQIFEILKNSCKTADKAECKTVLAAIHDLNLASLFCDELYVLEGKKIACHGKTEEILTDSMIKKIFNVDCSVAVHEKTGKKNIVFIPKV